MSRRASVSSSVRLLTNCETAAGLLAGRGVRAVDRLTPQPARPAVPHRHHRPRSSPNPRRRCPGSDPALRVHLAAGFADESPRSRVILYSRSGGGNAKRGYRKDLVMHGRSWVMQVARRRTRRSLPVSLPRRSVGDKVLFARCPCLLSSRRPQLLSADMDDAVRPAQLHPHTAVDTGLDADDDFQDVPAGERPSSGRCRRSSRWRPRVPPCRCPLTHFVGASPRPALPEHRGSQLRVALVVVAAAHRNMLDALDQLEVQSSSCESTPSGSLGPTRTFGLRLHIHCAGDEPRLRVRVFFAVAAMMPMKSNCWRSSNP